ncbi:MAG: response regulator transcription factor [Spirulinaceae cyanobacterium]
MSNSSTDRPQSKLLLVDDDPNLILLVRDYLEFRGFDVITAESGQEGLDHLANDIPDMIICDIMMPQMDGYAFVEKVRQNPQTEWIPFLFLSAKSQSGDRVKGLSEGADVYMTKPFEPEELVAQVESSLKQLDRFRAAGAGEPQSLSANALSVPENVSLTPKEKKVVKLVAQGLGNRGIAQKLEVSQRTVESHVSNMLGKTNLNNRTELARWAVESRQI